MKQEIKTWFRGETSLPHGTLDMFVHKLISQGYSIKNITITKFFGNQFFHAAKDAIIICEK